MKRNDLKAFRESLGMLQEDMATKIGYTRNYINSIENGKRDASIEFWDKFQKVFNVENEKMWSLTRKR